MPPKSDTDVIPKDQWVQLTLSDVTAATFQVRRGTVLLVPTVGAVPPTDLKKGVSYSAGQGEVAFAIADLAPGTAGVNRVYAYSAGESAEIYFSHA